MPKKICVEPKFEYECEVCGAKHQNEQSAKICEERKARKKNLTWQDISINEWRVGSTVLISNKETEYIDEHNRESYNEEYIAIKFGKIIGTREIKHTSYPLIQDFSGNILSETDLDYEVNILVLKQNNIKEILSQLKELKDDFAAEEL